MTDSGDLTRILEAQIFAAAKPVRQAELARQLPEGADVEALLAELVERYRTRGVNLVKAGDSWAFRTAADLSAVMQREVHVERKLSRAAIETLAIVAYHQPITRAEIEEVRGVGLSKGTLDVLLEAGWIKPKGRRRTPGRPVTWGTTVAFLDQFGLERLDDLPGLDELQAAGLLDKRPALTALASRGQLTELQEAEDTEEADGPEDGLDSGDAAELPTEEPLQADFGEDLLAPDSESDSEVAKSGTESKV